LRRSWPKFDSHELVRSTPALSEHDGTLLQPGVLAVRADLRDDRVAMAQCTGFSDGVVVVAPVEMEDPDVVEQPTPRQGVARRGESVQSFWLAGVGTQATGMPRASVATDHFQPGVPRSAGLGPVASPPEGALGSGQSTTRSPSSSPMIRS
jgi:hypothetical protein